MKNGMSMQLWNVEKNRVTQSVIQNHSVLDDKTYLEFCTKMVMSSRMKEIEVGLNFLKEWTAVGLDKAETPKSEDGRLPHS
jgi:hypothetical protein